MTSQTLQILIKAKLETDKAFKQAGTGLDKIGAAAERNRGKLLAVAGGIAAIGFVSIKAAADFEKGMATVNTLINVSQKQINALGDDVRELSKTFGIDAVEATESLYQTISAGIEPAKALEFLGTASKLAIAGVTDLETSVDGLTTVVNAFGFDASEAERVSDVLFETMRRGKTTVGELSDFMFQAAPVSAALGVSFEEMNAAVATLTKQGTPTRVAMTGIRQAIVALAKPTDDMTRLLDQLGFESGIAAIRAMGLQGTFEALATQTDATESELVKAVGSVEALTTVLGLTGANAAIFKEDLDAITNSAGAMAAGFEIASETAAQKLAIMQATITDLRIEIGNELLPTFITAVEGVSDLVTRFSEMDQGTRDLLKSAVLVTAAIVTLGLVLPPVIKGIALLRSAVLLLNTAFLTLLANPIVLAMAAIVAVLAFVTKSYLDAGAAARRFAEGNERVKESLDELVASGDLAELGIVRLNEVTEVLAATEESLAKGRKLRADQWLEQIQEVIDAQQDSVAEYLKGSKEISDIDARLAQSAADVIQQRITANAELVAIQKQTAMDEIAVAKARAIENHRIRKQEADDVIIELARMADAADKLQNEQFAAVQAMASIIRSNLNQGLPSLVGGELTSDFFKGFGANLKIDTKSGRLVGKSATTGQGVLLGPDRSFFNPDGSPKAFFGEDTQSVTRQRNAAFNLANPNFFITVEGSINAEDLAGTIQQGLNEIAARGGEFAMEGV